MENETSKAILQVPRQRTSLLSFYFFIALSIMVSILVTQLQAVHIPSLYRRVPPHISLAISRCQHLQLKTGPPPGFYGRTRSDRYVEGTKPILLRRARIWTGEKNGTEVIRGDILLDMGLIKAVGHVALRDLKAFKDELIIIDAKNAWVTPGIVDVHSHIGNSAAPELAGASKDYDSSLGIIQPWLRSLDGLNTHDISYELSVSGGITTVLVLPGSGNAIGGQGFTIKLRKPADRSPTSMLLEPPYQINSSWPDPGLPPRWRQMKHACGENPSNSYSGARMDTISALREAYIKADQIKQAQDVYCSKASSGQWDRLGEFPDDLQWEALVDVLRGRVKVHVHGYEAVDLDGLIRLSNEFRFPIAAFHHASEAYLTPNLLKNTFGKLSLEDRVAKLIGSLFTGGPPGIALFATNARYKREAYRSSEFAPRILSEHGLKVVMKSDHPVLNSRYLLYEAQQAYFYGLPEHLALASVTSTAAEILGLGHRVGFVKSGWDADLVLWDSHPLALGATPTQVFIDGIQQLKFPHVVHKPRAFQRPPEVPDFSREKAEAIEYEGLPPLEPERVASDVVIFENVKNFFLPTAAGIQDVFSTKNENLSIVIAGNGSILCSGVESSCLRSDHPGNYRVFDLRGGSISPGLVSFGSPLGLEHIAAEDSTNDGAVRDPLVRAVPMVKGNVMPSAVDGLQFATRDALLAYRAGVTIGITAPSHTAFYSGLSTVFSLGATHKLEEEMVIQGVAGLHVSISHFGGVPSVSTQIAALRRLLYESPKDVSAPWLQRVIDGEIPLVIEAHSVDIISTLIQLKMEFEKLKKITLKMTITGASEAHILAADIASAGIGVVINPPRPFPARWEDRRILPGPPLTELSAVAELLQHNVTVGIGVQEIWCARNTRFDLAWLSIEAGGRISKEQVFALASTNIMKLLGGVNIPEMSDLVATEGGDLLDMSGKVVAIISPRRNLVDVL